MRAVGDPAGAVQQILGMDETAAAPATGPNFEQETFAEQLAVHMGLVRASLTLRVELKPQDPVPMEFVGEFIKFVTMHEVGHTLGLRHNFRGSTDTPIAELHNRVWTGENGLVNSVMEHPAANIAHGRQAERLLLHAHHGHLGPVDDHLRLHAGRGAGGGRQHTLKGEFFLTDTISVMIEGGANVRTHNGESWLDTGTIEATLETNQILLDKMGSNASTFQRSNVEIVDPVAIDETAEISNSKIGPHVSIGANCRISNSTIAESILEGGCEIKDAGLIRSMIGRQAKVQGRGDGQVLQLNVGDNRDIVLS